MKRLLLFILMCSIAVLGKDKYDRKGSVSVSSGIVNQNAPSTVTVNGQTWGCNTTDTNIDCAEQKIFVHDALYIFDFHGQSGQFSYYLTSGKIDANNGFKMKGCDPLHDLVLKLIPQNGTAPFEYRYGKQDNEILVPCTFVDNKGNVKTEEARYEIILRP